MKIKIRVFIIHCIYNMVKGEDITLCNTLLAGREAESFLKENL